MNQFYPLLKENQLFYKYEDGELSHLLSCLRAELLEYKKDDTILLQGRKILKAGIVVQGSVYSHRVDIDGSKRILSNYNVGDIFCEELLFSNITIAPFSLTANEQTSIIQIDCSEIPKFCKLACIHHSKFVANLAHMLSAKIIRLDRKIEILQKSTIRDKLLSYFNFCAEIENSNSFTIPFSRQQLADYIGVNRSSASRELWKMKKDGVISFSERRFTLEKAERLRVY